MDKDVGAIVFHENMIDATLSGSCTIGDISITPEIRHDKVSVPLFIDGNTMKDSLAPFVLAAFFGF